MNSEKRSLSVIIYSLRLSDFIFMVKLDSNIIKIVFGKDTVWLHCLIDKATFSALESSVVVVRKAL